MELNLQHQLYMKKCIVGVLIFLFVSLFSLDSFAGRIITQRQIQ
jgi:hypothetical protein